MFVLAEHALPALASRRGSRSCRCDVDNGTAKFDLTLSLSETATGLEGWLEYNADLFDAATAERAPRPPRDRC